MKVSGDKWRAGMKFLMGLGGANPQLTTSDQRKLREFLRGPFSEGMDPGTAAQVLRDGMGWKRGAEISHNG